MHTNDIDIDKAYISPYDKFLYAFDASHDKTKSQLKEINKHNRIFKLRDNKSEKGEKGDIWESF